MKVETNEIINEMFKQSPLQKEWKPKEFDKTDKGYVESFEENHHDNCHGQVPDMVSLYNDEEYDRNKTSLIWYPSQAQLQKKYWDNVGGPTEMCEPGVETVCRILTKIDKTFTALSTWESSNDIVTRPPIVEGLNALSYPDLFHLLWCLLVHQEVQMYWSWGNSTAKWDWEEKKWKKN